MVEVNIKIEEPGDNNVHNNAFYAEEKLLKCELEAMRDCDPLSARHWIVRLLVLFKSFLFCLSMSFSEAIYCTVHFKTRLCRS